MKRDSPDADALGYTLALRAAVPTTFKVPVRARVLAVLHRTEAVPALLEALAGQELFVLGSGSNVLFTQDFPGAVLRMATRGVEIVSASDRSVRLRVAAGESWDAFVRWTLGRGLAGLENLILIPGTAGAAPIQNIGAYGVELAEFVSEVEAWDRGRARFVTLAARACRFAYRDSIFKREPGRWIVTGVVLELPRARDLRLDYRGVRDELRAMGVAEPGHADVAEAVERLRLRKLPDPAQVPNAGSFFKNPVVTAARAGGLARTHPGLPVYPTAEPAVAKLSAAWMIEACGCRGLRVGDAGVSERHALVLVNYGAASGADILALAGRIRAAVAERFGVELEAEPVIV